MNIDYNIVLTQVDSHLLCLVGRKNFQFGRLWGDSLFEMPGEKIFWEELTLDDTMVLQEGN